MAKIKSPAFSLMPIFKARNGVLPNLVLARKHLYLRPPKDSDWAEWAKLRTASRDFLEPFEPAWPRDALSRPAFRRRLRSYASEWEKDRTYAFFIFRAGDDALMGGLTMTNLRRGIVQSASLGYWVAQPYAGQGYMSEAIGAILKFGFDDLKLHRLEAACLLNNTASRRVLEKNSFRHEGEAKKYLKINGAWQDHLTFAVLREDCGSILKDVAREQDARETP